MITELLNLGIKGSDLVLRQLKQIQEVKKRLSAITNVNVRGSSSGLTSAAAIAGAVAGVAGSPLSRKSSEDDEKINKKNAEAMAGHFQNVGNSIANMDASGFAKSLVGMTAGLTTMIAGLDPTGSAARVVAATAQAANMTIDAAVTFKDHVKASAQTFGDTMDAQQSAMRYTKDAQFLRGGDNTSFHSRRDISVNEQRGIIEAVGGKFGKMSEDFKQSLREVYGTRDKPYDVKESTDIATGNFAGLGTDKGFFMQKIADSMGNLPPSARQKMQESLMGMISDDDRTLQSADSTYARNTNTTFDDDTRTQAEGLVKLPGAVENAKAIQDLTNAIEMQMGNGINQLVTALRTLTDKIKKEGVRTTNPPPNGQRTLLGTPY